MFTALYQWLYPQSAVPPSISHPPPMRPVTSPSYVLTNIGSDDPIRGDSQAYIELAKVFAEKTGRPWRYIDNLEASKQYPKAATSHDAYEQFFKENGYPEVVFGDTSILTRHSFNSFKFSVENEFVTAMLETPEFVSLVSHSVTQDKLDNAYDEFERMYPDLTGPIIGVMYIDHVYNDRTARKLINLIKHSDYDTATIYICGTRRTEVQDMIRFRQELEDAVFLCGMDNKINILQYQMSIDFNERANNYNPYLGLIAKASHIAVFGNSQSIVSECLMAGKPLLLSSNHDHPDLLNANICYGLHSFKIGDRFPEHSIPSLNVTSMVVDKIVAEFTTIQQQYQENPDASDMSLLCDMRIPSL